MAQLIRRDFLNGVAWLGVGSALHPLQALAAVADADVYPPALTGLRGAHPGSFEAAHALAWGAAADSRPIVAQPEAFDLIVIGAGISGLSAAYFYRQQVKRDARILILDNHDDFGGHAKRNEFTVDGQTLISYGGSQSFDTPRDYSQTAARLLRELGVDLPQLERAYDSGFFARHGLGSGVFYDAAGFGRSALLRSGLPLLYSSAQQSKYWVPGLKTTAEFAATLDQAPLSAQQRKQLRQVLAGSDQASTYFRGAQGSRRFYEQSYVQYLNAVYGITDAALLTLLSMPLDEDAALGGSGVSLPLALEGGLLGLPSARRMARWLNAPDLLPEEEDPGQAYVHHFPDGNASLARLLVQRLVPRVATLTSAAQAVSTRFDYSQLDSPDQAVRIRLSSLAVRADNTAQGATVDYLRDGQRWAAHAPQVVMAGWHMPAARIIPSLAPQQKAAMRANVKMPLVYAQVALRRWHAVQRSGVAAAYCPGAYFQFVQMDFPVALGSYQPRREPDSPVVLLMIRMPCPPLVEAPVVDLLRQGRADLLASDFATFETNIRQQLSAMYGAGGFDAARDIAAITLNRWPHGYVYEGAQYDGQSAHVLASRRHGNIAMANADSAGLAYADAAIDAAWRAVQELKSAA